MGEQGANRPFDDQRAGRVAQLSADLDAGARLGIAAVVAKPDFRARGECSPPVPVSKVRSAASPSRKRLTSPVAPFNPVVASDSVHTHIASDLSFTPTPLAPDPSSNVPVAPTAPMRMPSPVSMGTWPALRSVTVRSPGAFMSWRLLVNSGRVVASIAGSLVASITVVRL